MKCEIPGCDHEVCKNVQVRGIVSGVYLDKLVHVCDNHNKHEVVSAVYVQNAPLVNPYLEAVNLRRV